MIPIRYIIFAGIATGANLFSQFIVLHIYNGLNSLYVAIGIGTLSGLIVKYVLDKKYIFYYKPAGRLDNGHKFILYSFTGAFTTLIFWGTEIVFDFFYSASYSKYIGALIGLSIGYSLKYFLDKNLVFKRIHTEI